MYTVGRLAKKFGLSRSTLLYYDSIGLLSPSSHVKGEYRKYSEADLELLGRICMYRKVGVSLKDIKHILSLETSITTAEVLEHRLQELGKEVSSAQRQQKIIAGLLSKSTIPESMNVNRWTSMFNEAGFTREEMHSWHSEFERMNPKEHAQFLKVLAMPEKEIEMIRSWSAAPQSILRLNRESNEFLSTFFRIYEQLDRKGPGSFSDTQRALNGCPVFSKKMRLLDIGCGSGANAVDLARMSFAEITSIDVYEPYIEEARAKVLSSDMESSINVQQADMAKLPFPEESFDIIWSEGAAYIMGFDAALAYWKSFIVPHGYIVLSEAVWLSPYSLSDIPHDLRLFWQEAYPGMRNTEQNISAIKSLGYKLLKNFIISQENWDIFYNKLEQHVANLPKQLLNLPYADKIISLIKREIELYRKYKGFYGYEFYVLEKE